MPRPQFMTPTTDVTRERLERLMTTQTSVRPYDFQLESFSSGCCTIRIPSSPNVQGPGGILAGPVFMAAADFTMWLAMVTCDEAAERAVTVDLMTKFLSNSHDEDVLCTARLLKWGRRLIVGLAECTTEEGRLLTHHTITYSLASPK